MEIFFYCRVLTSVSESLLLVQQKTKKNKFEF